jgi:hypothetical protein
VLLPRAARRFINRASTLLTQRPMSEKTESEEYEEDDAEEAAEDTGDDLDVDHLIKDLETLKRRGPKISDPAWRRLERYMEEKHTSELLSDFDDYDIGVEDGGGGNGASRHRKKKRR